MSFGGGSGGSNPPWQRNAPGNQPVNPNGVPSMQQQIINSGLASFQNMALPHQAPQNNMLMQPLGAANMAAMNNPSPMFGQGAQFQNQRGGLNPHAFAAAPNAPQLMQHHQMQPGGGVPAHQGQMNQPAQLGPAFNWAAGSMAQQPQGGFAGNNQRPMQQQPQLQSNPPQRDFQGNQAQALSAPTTTERPMGQSSTARGSGHGTRHASPTASASKATSDRSGRRHDDEDRRKRDERRDKDREKERGRRDERSPVRKSPPRRQTKPIPRYIVQMPRFALVPRQADLLTLRQRYTNLYIPSDFFSARIRWVESFPPHNPFTLNRPCSFHVFHKSVVNPNLDNNTVFEAPDADSSYVAKVMLMGVPPMSEMYRKCFASAEEKDRDDLVHPSRLITFLVGMTGKNETMAIGGSWSPSLDGAEPERDRSVLVNTATRTFKALTGIDLSKCHKWYRFVDLYYRRLRMIRRNGRDVLTASVQTVVIFLVDARPCLPTHVEWDLLAEQYKQRYHEESKPADGSEGGSAEATVDASTCESAATATQPEPDPEDDAGACALPADDQPEPEPEDDAEACALPVEEEAVVGAIVKVGGSSNPTKFTELNVKAMQMGDLREELNARGLSSTGIKTQLMARLSKALKAEEADVDDSSPAKRSEDLDVMEGLEFDLNDIVVIDEYDSTKNETKQEEQEKKALDRRIDEREKRWLEKRYRLPEQPQVLCHPQPQPGYLEKFSCEVVSLSVLLDYQMSDKKRHSFEVSLFAELFNDMLMRDFGFTIYKSMSHFAEGVAREERARREADHQPKSDADEPAEKKYRKSEAGEQGESSRTSKRIDSAKKSEADTKSESKDREKSSGGGGAGAGTSSSSSNRDKEKRDRERRPSRRDEETEEEKAAKSRETKKMVTVEPDLLLAFVYFDRTHCGYIFNNHLEELLQALGLMLTRRETKDLLNRVAPRALYYRKLTDKPKDEKHEPAEMQPEAIVDLGKGNTHLLPGPQPSGSGEGQARPAGGSGEDMTDGVDVVDGIGPDPRADGVRMVMHNGALIDVAKLMQQIAQAELAREQTEQRINELIRANGDLQSSGARAKDKIKDLQSELKSSNRKLTEAESNLSGASKKNTEYHSILSGVYDKVSPMFVKHERASKKDSALRDKDRKDREKERTSSATANKDGKEGKERDACKKELAREKDVKDKELKGKEARDKSAADVKAEPNGKAVKGKEVKDKGGAEKGSKVNDKDVPFNNINSNVVNDKELTDGDTVKVVNDQVKQLELTEIEPSKADASAGADVAIQHDILVE